MMTLAALTNVVWMLMVLAWMRIARRWRDTANDWEETCENWQALALRPCPICTAKPRCSKPVGPPRKVSGTGPWNVDVTTLCPLELGHGGDCREALVADDERKLGVKDG